MTNIIDQAAAFAAGAHAAVKQTRKYSGEPYVVHPIEVRAILCEFAADPVTTEQECAALLHDVVEDTGVTLADVERTFGARVAQLVSDLTDVSKPEDGNRRVRKQLDLDHTAAADPAAKTVKLADLISNTRSIVAHDPDFARVYVHEKARILAVCSDADPGLLAEAHRVLEEAQRLLAKG